MMPSSKRLAGSISQSDRLWPWPGGCSMLDADGDTKSELECDRCRGAPAYSRTLSQCAVGGVVDVSAGAGGVVSEPRSGRKQSLGGCGVSGCFLPLGGER